MSSCGHCGDIYPDGDVHNCWVLARNWAQETLPPPDITDYVGLGRPVETDADWYASHGHAD